MRKIVLFLGLVFLCSALQAQNTKDSTKRWSLEECINYAIDHNITIKQWDVRRQNAEVDLNTSKTSRLPNLNAGVGQNWNFGRTNNNRLGVYEVKTISNTGFSVSSSTPIFTGFQISNQIARNELDLKTAIENLNKAKEDLSLKIAQLYLQSLFNKELYKIGKEQLELSIFQVGRTKTLVEVGKVPQSQLFDIEAQVAKDEVTVVQAKNNLDLALLDLAQSLELERASSFDIEEPFLGDVIQEYMSSVLPPAVIYDRAILIKPVVKSQEFRLEGAKKDLKIAQSGYLPKLNLNLSYNNSYFYDYRGENVSFSDQLKNNGGESIGLSLSIPIFNRFQVRNQVKSAQLNIQTMQLELEDVKKSLFKEIQTAYLNASAAQEKYKSSDRAVKASSESFKYAKDRYETGKTSVFEFNEARIKLIQSQSEQLQAKYDYIFRTKILDFYNGIPIKL